MRPLVCAVLVILALGGCKREERSLRTDPPALAALDRVAVMPNGISGAPAAVNVGLGDPYQGNAYQLSQGKRLFTWFNCRSCHANGGGGSGPALINKWWRYGPDRVSIYVSIRDGRLNGMPAFRDKLTPEQIWQLTGYVQTLGAYSARTAAPSRNDEIQSRPAENRAPAAADIVPPPSR
jgi:cytochrome c oxidase cbb3-type subunit III